MFIWDQDARAKLGTDLSGTGTETLYLTPSSGRGWSIGGEYDYNAPWYGQIDDVTIFNRILTPTEGLTLKDQTFNVTGGSMPLLHYYNRQARI